MGKFYIFHNYEKLQHQWIEHLKYGDNLGNNLFLNEVKALFNAIPINIHDNDDVNFLKQTYVPDDIILLCLANCLSEYWNANYLIKLIEENNFNILLFSIGIQKRLTDADNTALSADVHKLLSLTKYPVFVRGSISSTLLNSYGIRNHVIGCPTITSINEISFNKFPTKIAFQCSFYRIEDEIKLLKFGIQNKWDYIIQSEWAFAVFKNNIDTLTSKKIDAKALRLLNQDECLTLKELLRFPTTMSEWKELLSDKDYLISTRIHGCLLALQMGIMCICIVTDVRTKELVELFNIPHILVTDIKQYDLSEFWKLSIEGIDKFNKTLKSNKERVLDAINNIKLNIFN